MDAEKRCAQLPRGQRRPKKMGNTCQKGAPNGRCVRWLSHFGDPRLAMGRQGMPARSQSRGRVERRRRRQGCMPGVTAGVWLRGNGLRTRWRLRAPQGCDGRRTGGRLRAPKSRGWEMCCGNGSEAESRQVYMWDGTVQTNVRGQLGQPISRFGVGYTYSLGALAVSESEAQ
jgi:hypothetical protein